VIAVSASIDGDAMRDSEPEPPPCARSSAEEGASVASSTRAASGSGNWLRFVGVTRDVDEWAEQVYCHEPPPSVTEWCTIHNRRARPPRDLSTT